MHHCTEFWVSVCVCVELLRSTLLAAFKYTIQSYSLQSPCCVLQPQKLTQLRTGPPSLTLRPLALSYFSMWLFATTRKGRNPYPRVV